VGLEVLARTSGVAVSNSVAPLDPGSVPFADAAGQLTEDVGRFSYGTGTGLDLRRPTATDVVLRSRVVGDTADRLTVSADGKLTLNPAPDRAIELIHTDPMHTSVMVALRTDAHPRWAVTANGTVRMGTGATAPELRLLPVSATVLQLQFSGTGGGLQLRNQGGTGPVYAELKDTEVIVRDTRLSVYSGTTRVHQLSPTSGIGFFGVGLTLRQTVTALTTLITGITPGDVIPDAPATYDQANERQARVNLLTKINQIRTALVNYGLLQ